MGAFESKSSHEVSDQVRSDGADVGEGWATCAVTLRRGYVSGAFVAVEEGAGSEEIGRSPSFRLRKGSALTDATEVAASLAGLTAELESSGWERIEEDAGGNQLPRFRRRVIPLRHRISAYMPELDPESFLWGRPHAEEPAPAVRPTARRSKPTRAPAKRLAAEGAAAARVEAERLEAERLEAERLEVERLEAERVEAERLEAVRVEAERVEAERVEAERVEAERVEAERVEAERVEAERLEVERLEVERLEVERLEAERVEAERLEAERLAAERLAAERLAAERLAAERVEAERVEAGRVEAERLAAERLEADRLAADRLAAERLETERRDTERLEADRLEAERAEAARLGSARLEAEEAARLAAIEDETWWSAPAGKLPNGVEPSELADKIGRYSTKVDPLFEIRRLLIFPPKDHRQGRRGGGSGR